MKVRHVRAIGLTNSPTIESLIIHARGASVPKKSPLRYYHPPTSSKVHHRGYEGSMIRLRHWSGNKYWIFRIFRLLMSRDQQNANKLGIRIYLRDRDIRV